MKKLMVTLLTMLLAFSLVACANVNEGKVRVGSTEITLEEFKGETADVEKFNVNFNSKHAILKGTISAIDAENKTITVGDFCVVTVSDNQLSSLKEGDKVSIIGKITSLEEGKVFFADKNKFN